MKKLILIIAVTISTLVVTSCEPQDDCTCGVVENVTQFTLPGGQSFGGYRLRNICTGQISNHTYKGVPPRNGTTLCD